MVICDSSPRKLIQEGKVSTRFSDKEVIRNHGERSFSTAVKGSRRELMIGEKWRLNTGNSFENSGYVGKEERGQ